jgi:hypothetical protein
MFNFKSKRAPELYRACRELPIHNFNEVANNNDFSFLKKNNQDVVSDEVLQLAWLDILDEFLKISNNVYADNILNKKSKIILLHKRLEVLQAMKYCIIRNIDIEAELKEYRIKKDKIDVQISLVQNDINRLSNSLPKEQEQQASSEEGNQNFEASIAVLLEKGYRIDRYTMVVTEWTAALNRIEKQNKANSHG